MKLNKIARGCAAAATGAVLLMAGEAQAANWLMLQGTEPASAAGRAKVWGFIQAQYQHDFSDPNPKTGAYAPPKLIGPNLESQSAFNVNRARIGVRGQNFPLDAKTNYFFLAEFGNNAITQPGNAFAKITDASVTLNHIPGARVRVGLFKTPGAEEALQAIHVFDYINFTTVTNQLLLERNNSDNSGSASGPTGSSLNAFDESVSAVRDTGIQVFDTFKRGDWEHSYAFMVGNGNGLNFGDDNDAKDIYLYWSSEKVFGGKGPRRQGWKTFAWYQGGERQFDADSDGYAEYHDRTRYGVGTKYLKKPFRVTAEYMKGDGMIFVGPDKPNYAMVPPATNNPNHAGNGVDNSADGWYIEGGWYIPKTKWEIDLRYDVYNRLTDPMSTNAPFTADLETKFETLTVGAQYHFNKKTRVNMEYAFRDFNAINDPRAPNGNGPNDNLDGVDGRAAIQVTAVF